MEKRCNLSIEFVADNKEQHNMVPLEFEEHMLQVVGDAAEIIPNEIKDLELKDLKDLFKRYLNILRRTYEVNIKPQNTSLMKQIDMDIDFSQAKIKNVKSMDELCLLMLAAIGELNFLILGGRLDNRPKSNKKTFIRDDMLKLNEYYSIHYSQTPFQKANLICDYAKNEKTESFEQIANKRFETRKDEDFIEWIKENFADIYLRLF